jgi:hypothetical protein
VRGGVRCTVVETLGGEFFFRGGPFDLMKANKGGLSRLCFSIFNTKGFHNCF